ncbi:MAG: hypothetical protein J6A63_07230 [Clostridia bacterium]|nr:hypothetical protein [Clostridia bacterium]
MNLMQRLGGDLTDEYVDEYVAAATKYDGACDGVWISTKYGYPPKAVHKQAALTAAKAAEKFRAKGIFVDLQLSNTLGHGEYMSARDCSGLLFENSPIERMVGHDGSVSDYSYCWRGTFFRQYINETLAYYVEAVKPDCVWVDDDLRVNNHAPVQFGCFCPRCVRAFNDEYGVAFTRETLVEEILHGDIAWRKKYVAFLRKGMYDFVYELGKTIHSVSKHTAMGYQYCNNGAYSGYGYSFIFDAMRAATGLAPKSRPGGGAYNDHDVNGFLYKVMGLNWQNAMLPDYVECKCPEIENLPFVVYGKSPAGTAFETSYYFANGNTDMSYSMVMTQNEPWTFYEQTFALFSKNRRYWERLSACNKQSRQAGLQYFLSEHIGEKRLSKEQDIAELNNEYSAELWPFLHTGIPFAYDKGDDTVTLLHPQSAQFASDKEIDALLKKAVVTDGETIELLKKRGVDLGITATRIPEKQALLVYELLQEHPSNKGGLKQWKSNFFTPGKREAYYFTAQREVETLGVYKNSVALEPFTNHAQAPYGISSLIITTPQGGRWAVLGYTPWKGVISHARREQYLNVVDYISDNGLCARIRTPLQTMLLPRTDENGKTVCVSVTNCTVGESGELEILIRNPKTESFVFMAQGGIEQKLTFEKTDAGYVVKTPSLAPWSVCTIFCNE